MNEKKSNAIRQTAENRKTTALWAGLSFFLPAAAVFAVLAACGVTPFGNATLIPPESSEWFANFCRMYESILSGDGIFCHWNTGFGRSFYAEFAAGQCTPFLFVALFFPSRYLAAAYSVITMLRAGLAGLFAWCMLYECTGARKDLCFALSCGYALGGFTACAAYYPSVADGAVFFPLLILGIYVYVTRGKPLRLFLFASLFFLTCSRLFVGGILICFLFYFAFHFRRKDAVIHLHQFALFAATLLCAAGTALALILPSGAIAAHYKNGVFSRVNGVDMLSSLCFGGGGTRMEAGEGFVCLAGLLIAGLVAFALNNRVSLYERIFVCAAAAMTLLAAALPPVGSILYGFCAYTDEKVNIGFVLTAAAVYATARHFATPRGSRLLTAYAAAGVFALLGGVSLLLRGTELFAALTEAGLAVVLITVFLLLSYHKNDITPRLALVTAGALAIFGVVHCDAAIRSIPPVISAQQLTDATEQRLSLNRAISGQESQRKEALRFFRRRSTDSAATEGVSPQNSRAAGTEAFAARLGILASSQAGGGENFTPLTDILFAVGYVVENSQPHALTQSVQSPAFAIGHWQVGLPAEGNAFETQNAIAESWFGQKPFFVTAQAELAETTDSSVNERYKWTFGNETTRVCRYCVELKEGDSLYLLSDTADCGYAVNDDSRSNWRTARTGGIYTVCENAAAGIQTIFISSDSSDDIPAPAFAILSTQSRQSLVTLAARKGGRYISRRGSQVNCMLTATESDSMGVTTIPYVYGWQVTVNGKSREPVSVCGGFIGIPLTHGENSIVMRYKPPFFTVSLTVSGLLLLLGLYTSLFNEHEISRRRKVSLAFRAIERAAARGEIVGTDGRSDRNESADFDVSDLNSLQEEIPSFDDSEIASIQEETEGNSI